MSAVTNPRRLSHNSILANCTIAVRSLNNLNSSSDLCYRWKYRNRIQKIGRNIQNYLASILRCADLLVQNTKKNLQIHALIQHKLVIRRRPICRPKLVDSSSNIQISALN